ncbi:AAA family ATPase [Roseivivax sp. CAU 1753]
MSAPYAAGREAFLKYLLLDGKERAQTRVPDRTLPDKPQVLPALLELFQGKCAFCEGSGTPLVPYRFRPPNGLSDPDLSDAHIYYAWLSDVWQNLYPICTDCGARSAHGRIFPVDGARLRVPDVSAYAAFVEAGTGVWPEPFDEAQLLFDPCVDDAFAQGLSVDADGVFEAGDDRAGITIEVFDLNRDALVERRRIAIADAEAKWAEHPDWQPPGIAEFHASLMFRRAHRTVPEQAEPPELIARRKSFVDFSIAEAKRRAAEEPIKAYSRLAHVEIESFKGIARAAFDIPPAPSEDTAAALLILGENATGKSSILEGIALTMIDHEAVEALGEDPVSYLLDPAFMGVAWMARAPEARVLLRFEGRDGRGDVDHLQLRVTPDRITSSGSEMGIPIFAYGAYRHYQSNQRLWRADRAVRSLFHSDDLLSNPEKWLLSLPEDHFDMVVRALRVVMGGGFRIIQREEKRCLVIVEEDGVSLRTPLDTVSSGFRTILALTCDLMRWAMRHPRFGTLESYPAVVLIDEVEAHLHPRWKVSIMDGLRRAFPAATFIVTTHDPLCLRGMRDGEVMVLQRVPGVSRDTDLPVFVDTLRELPDVTKLTVEQLLTSDLFDLFDTDDPRTGQAMADLADALAVSRAAIETGTDLAEDVQATIQKFQTEVRGALPVGSTEVARIVEEAVAEYVLATRHATATRRRSLRQATKDKIKRALARESG